MSIWYPNKTLNVRELCLKIQGGANDCCCPYEKCLNVFNDLLRQAHDEVETDLRDNCGMWVDNFRSDYKDNFGSNGCFTMKNQVWTYRFFYYSPEWAWRLRHRAIRITVCNGTEFYLDDGWWDEGMYRKGKHHFPACNIPNTVVPGLGYGFPDNADAEW